jgi:hypothetical protein
MFGRNFHYRGHFFGTIVYGYATARFKAAAWRQIVQGRWMTRTVQKPHPKKFTLENGYIRPVIIC